MFDVFNANPDTFNELTLMGHIENAPNNPTMLRDMNLFRTEQVRTKKIMIDVTDDSLELIGFSERGGPKQQIGRETRKSLDLDIPRMAAETKMHAPEIANLRATGQDFLMNIQTELSKKLVKMNSVFQYTDEYLQLAAVQGLVLDPKDGSTYYDFHAEFGPAAAAEINFVLGTATTKVKQKCEELVISIQRAAKGAWVPGVSRVEALIGDDFWFDLTQHATVKEFYAGWPAMAYLKDLDPSSVFDYGGIIFRRYIGSDDNSEIAIGTDKAKFFVSGGRDIFVKAQAPADEHIAYVNTLGRPSYIIQKDDYEYANAPRWKGWDMLAYPLYICQRPQTLRTGRRN